MFDPTISRPRRAARTGFAAGCAWVARTPFDPRPARVPGTGQRSGGRPLRGPAWQNPALKPYSAAFLPQGAGGDSLKSLSRRFGDRTSSQRKKVGGGTIMPRPRSPHSQTEDSCVAPAIFDKNHQDTGSMRYQQSKQQSAEVLRMALAHMTRHEAAFHPPSYALWYVHSAGINPALTHALEERLASDVPLTDAE